MNPALFLKYAYLTGKRLLRRKLFLAMLAALFLSAFALGRIAVEDQGIVRIAVFEEGGGDELTRELITKLSKEQGLFSILPCGSRREAEEAVDGKAADAAWIFAPDFSESVGQFARSRVRREPAVTVYEREDSAALKLAREKLFALLYPDLSFGLFEDFVIRRTEEVNAEPYGDRELRSYYHAGVTSEPIVEHRYLQQRDNIPGETSAAAGAYLVAPVRGMAALIILLCMMAAAMYCREDREKGLCGILPGGGRGPLVLCYLLPAGVLSGAASIAAMYAAGIGGFFTGEVLSMAAYLVSGMVFTSVLYCILPSSGSLAAALPFVMLAVLLQCPVFLDIPSMQPLRVLLPPTCYLRLCSLLIA